MHHSPEVAEDGTRIKRRLHDCPMRADRPLLASSHGVSVRRSPQCTTWGLCFTWSTPWARPLLRRLHGFNGMPEGMVGTYCFTPSRRRAPGPRARYLSRHTTGPVLLTDPPCPARLRQRIPHIPVASLDESQLPARPSRVRAGSTFQDTSTPVGRLRVARPKGRWTPPSRVAGTTRFLATAHRPPRGTQQVPQAL